MATFKNVFEATSGRYQMGFTGNRGKLDRARAVDKAERQAGADEKAKKTEGVVSGLKSVVKDAAGSGSHKQTERQHILKFPAEHHDAVHSAMVEKHGQPTGYAGKFGNKRIGPRWHVDDHRVTLLKIHDEHGSHLAVDKPHVARGGGV
jgi:hypothetical protein